MRYAGNGIELLARREPEAFAADDFTRPTNRPIGATTFLGRPAWTVELAPPQHKPHPIQLVVDAETGLVLQRRNDAFGTVAEWTEFVAGEQFDPALFRWDGSSRSHTERRASRQAEFEAEESARRAWFEANVVGLPLTVEVAVGISVNEFDEATGAFQAGIGDSQVGALARRSASDAPWELGWAEVQHRWSDGSWDWAVTIFRDTLTPGGLKALRRQLAAGPT